MKTDCHELLGASAAGLHRAPERCGGSQKGAEPASFRGRRDGASVCIRTFLARRL